MIFKLLFIGNKAIFAQGQSELHVLQSYSIEYEDFLKIKKVVHITDDEAKDIWLNNEDYDADDKLSPEKISLFSLSMGNRFEILGKRN